MTKALAYVRVSTEEQAREGLSLGVQESRIKAYCLAKNLVMEKVYTDAGRSAKSINRPAFTDLVQNLQSGDAVVAVKLDRLFRNTRDALGFVDLLKERGAELICIDEGIDTVSPTGKFTFTLFAALAQLERDQTAERTKRVIGALKESGKKYGPAPFGKYAEGSTLVDDRSQLAAAAQIRLLRSQGMSLREIASWLGSQGIRTPRGGPWQHSTVRYLLEKEGS